MDGDRNGPRHVEKDGIARQQFVQTCEWILDERFPEVPSEWLRREGWAAKLDQPWRRRRHVCTFVVLAFDRSRVETFDLMRHIHRLRSHLLERVIDDASVRWIPFEFNSSDTPSRLCDPHHEISTHVTEKIPQPSLASQSIHPRTHGGKRMSYAPGSEEETIHEDTTLPRSMNTQASCRQGPHTIGLQCASATTEGKRCVKYLNMEHSIDMVTYRTLQATLELPNTEKDLPDPARTALG